MGYVEMIKLNPQNPDHKLDVCDKCGQKGVIKFGHMINDNHGEPMIFLCFNCKEKILN